MRALAFGRKGAGSEARYRRVAAALAVSCAMLAALVAPTMGAAAEPPRAKARFGGTPSLLYFPIYIAIEQAHFAKRGIEAELISTNTPEPALIGGDIDFSMRSAEVGVTAAARGKPTPAVMMLQQRNSLSVDLAARLAPLVAGKSYPRNVEQLKGKGVTVAITARGSSAELFVKQTFAGAGMEEGRDYSIVVVGGGAGIIGALRANRVEVVNLWPPFSQQAYTQNVAVPLVQQAKREGPAPFRDGAGIALLTNPSYLKSNEDAVRRIVAAITEAQEFNRDFKANRSRLMEIAKKYTGVTDEAVLDAAIQIQASLAYAGVECKPWSVTAKLLMSVGTIEKEPSCDLVVARNIAPQAPLGP